MADTLDLLLRGELKKPEMKEIKIRRLSEQLGEDVVFKIRALTYAQVADIKDRNQDDSAALSILLAGVVNPDLRSKELMDKFKVYTPPDMLKELLLPGEIEDLAREIEKLSGYRSVTIEEIKKK